MAGPTPENPFATLNKRLKRARFYDRQERLAYDATLSVQKDMTRKPVSAWEIAQRPAPAMQEQEVRRPEPARARTTSLPATIFCRFLLSIKSPILSEFVSSVFIRESRSPGSSRTNVVVV